MENSNLLKDPGVTSSLKRVVYSVVEISEKAEEGGLRHRPHFRHHFSSISCIPIQLLLGRLLLCVAGHNVDSLVPDAGLFLASDALLLVPVHQT